MDSIKFFVKLATILVRIVIIFLSFMDHLIHLFGNVVVASQQSGGIVWILQMVVTASRGKKENA